MNGSTVLRLLLMALWFAAGATGVFAATRDDEAGINERLGKNVPLELRLLDEAGQAVRLGDLIDKPTVLTLNYFRCGGICTPQLNELVRVVNELGLEPGREFQIITVSFDSADTPAVAAEKRTNYLKLLRRPFPPNAWRFLTGASEATRALADSVGFAFKKRESDFIHPGALILLSPQGKVTRYIYGITYLPADLEMAVGEAAAGVSRPTISKMLSFCYSFDPESRGYVLNVTRLAGVATLLFAGVLGGVVLFVGRGRGRTERATR